MSLFQHGVLRRLVALLMFFLMFSCIVGEDLFALNSCSEDSAGPSLDLKSAATTLSSSCEGAGSKGSDDRDHDCLCCCHHVLPQRCFEPGLAWTISHLNPTPGIALPSVDLFPPYHPPQA